MIPTTTTDFLFRQAYHEALIAVGEAAGSSSRIRGIYRAAVNHDNPKHALVLTRHALVQIDETYKALAQFKTSLLAIAAEIETQIPPPPQP
jgi:uncharacterized protein (DUF2336 family)